MGFMDGIRKLTQPYSDDDDFFDGAEESFAPSEPEISDTERQFENAFGTEQAVGEPEPASSQQSGRRGRFTSGAGGSIFGNLGNSSSSAPAAPRQPRQNRRAQAQAGGFGDQSVIRFTPKDFDEAGELYGFLEDGKSLIMSLEDVPADLARRLLDFMSGIAFALSAKINPVSAKTYFITPENVDFLDAQPRKEQSDDF